MTSSRAKIANNSNALNIFNAVVSVDIFSHGTAAGLHKTEQISGWAQAGAVLVGGVQTVTNSTQ